jgi:glycosyltransferase involved in cell wall biosynthesis
VPAFRSGPAGSRPPHILFGGIYDWYDPILAIDAVAIARATLPDASLTFTTHPNPSLTPQGKTADAMKYAKQRGFEAFVHFEPWVEYEKRGAFFDRFAAALLTFPQSLETNLSMRTRVYDYLWGGLPIVTSSAPGTDEILTRYGAGAIVRSSEPREFAHALADVIGRRQALAAGARQFVLEHQWPAVLEPLRAFVRHPKLDATKEEFAVKLQVPERPPSILDRLKRRIGGAF